MEIFQNVYKLFSYCINDKEFLNKPKVWNCVISGFFLITSQLSLLIDLPVLMDFYNIKVDLQQLSSISEMFFSAVFLSNMTIFSLLQ